MGFCLVVGGWSNIPRGDKTFVGAKRGPYVSGNKNDNMIKGRREGKFDVLVRLQV